MLLSFNQTLSINVTFLIYITCVDWTLMVYTNNKWMSLLKIGSKVAECDQSDPT